MTACIPRGSRDLRSGSHCIIIRLGAETFKRHNWKGYLVQGVFTFTGYIYMQGEINYKHHAKVQMRVQSGA
jgi:hypothetical protein